MSKSKTSAIKDKQTKSSLAYVFAPPPLQENSAVERSVRKLRGRHIEIRWTMPALEVALQPRSEGMTTVEDVVRRAVRTRVHASQERAERALRRFGVRTRAVDMRRHMAGAEEHR